MKDSKSKSTPDYPAMFQEADASVKSSFTFFKSYAYNNRAIARYNLGDIEGAFADFTQVIALDPENAVVYNIRGYAYDAQGQFDLAIADYTRAIALNPGYTTAYRNRGYTYNKQGKFGLAIADLTQAIALDPKRASPYKHRSTAFAALGYEKEAAGDKAMAIKLGATFDDVAKAEPEPKKNISQEILERGPQRMGQNSNNAPTEGRSFLG